MFSSSQLLSITTKPSQSDVSLLTLQTFYEEHLCNRIYVYETNDPEHRYVKFQFQSANFWHLLGLHHIYENQKGHLGYTANQWYQAIKDEQITFETLKKTNQAKFKEQKNRFLYFPFAYQILQNPTVITFSKEILTKPTKIECDLIFYNQYHTVYLHLCLGQDKDSDFYYPKSFLDRKNDFFVVGQKQVAIVGKQIELLTT